MVKRKIKEKPLISSLMTSVFNRDCRFFNDPIKNLTKLTHQLMENKKAPITRCHSMRVLTIFTK